MGDQRFRLDGTTLTVRRLRTTVWELDDVAWILARFGRLPVLLSAEQVAELAEAGRVLPGQTLQAVDPVGNRLVVPAAVITGELGDRLARALRTVPGPASLPHPSALARIADRPGLSGWLQRHVVWAPARLARTWLISLLLLAAVLVAVGLTRLGDPENFPLGFGSLLLVPSLALAGWIGLARRRAVRRRRWPYPVLRALYENLLPGGRV